MYNSQDSGRYYSRNTSINAEITSGTFQEATYNSGATTVYTTRGGGLFYNNAVIGFSNVQTLQLAPDGSMYIGTNGWGVYQSSDKGKSWNERNTGLLNLDIRDIEFASDGKMYVATKVGAFVSTDKGINWNEISPTTPSLEAIIEGQPKDGITVFGVGNYTFQRLGGNLNWNGGVDPLTTDMYTVKYHPQLNKYLVGGKYGIWTSATDYVAWTQWSNFPFKTVYDIEIDTDGRIVALTNSDLYYSDNSGVDWQTMTFIPKNYKHDLLIDTKGNYYVATDGGVYYSTDRGGSWIEMNDGFVNLPYSPKITSLALDNENYLWAGSTTTGVYRSKVPVTTSAGLSNVANALKGVLNVTYEESSAQLTVVLQNNERISGLVSIYSMDGRCVLYDQQATEVDAQTKVFSACQLTSGVYLLTLNSDQTIYSQKFIVK